MAPHNIDFAMSHELGQIAERRKQCSSDTIGWDLNAESNTIETSWCGTNCSEIRNNLLQ